MAKYEALPTTPILHNETMLQTQKLPELVYMDDPAMFVMTDFTKTPPHVIDPAETLDHAINEMEVNDVHLLIVLNEKDYFQGVVSSEDVWGEKPIQLIQERRIHRDQVTVKMIMVPYTDVIALDFNMLGNARVGNIVKTLTENKQHYALAVSPEKEKSVHMIRGIFTISQICKQLHMDGETLFDKNVSLSELHKTR